MGNKVAVAEATEGASLQPQSHAVVQNPQLHSREIRSEYLHKLGLGKSGKGPVLPLPSSVPAWLKDYHADSEEDETRSKGSTKSTDSEPFAEEETFALLLSPKTNDEIRVRLMQRMSHLGQWVPATERPPAAQTIIIFDWDDTLLCTSFLNQLSSPLSISDDATLARLQQLDLAAASLLRHSASLGRNYIITNAMKGWVEFSASKWLPTTAPLLADISIVSARSEYEQLYPGNFHQWKERAFLQIPQLLGTDPVTNLVVLGDSMVEMDAAKTLRSCYARACIKTIKFQDSPSPDELAKQLALVSCKFQEICTAAKDMTIRLERRAEMDALAELFLSAVRVLSRSEGQSAGREAKGDALRVVQEVLKARMPVPASLLVQVLAGLALTLKSAPQLLDSALAVLQDAVAASAVTADCIYAAPGELQPWLTIVLDALVPVCRASSADCRKRAWRLLHSLVSLVQDAQAAFTCFPGLFHAVLAEVRSNSNQLVGTSAESLSSALDLAASLAGVLLADAAQEKFAREARSRSQSALQALLDSLLACLQNPLNAQHGPALRSARTFLRVLVEDCPEFVSPAHAKLTPLLVWLSARTELFPLRCSLSLRNSLFLSCQAAFQRFVTATGVPELESLLSSWRLLQDEQTFFAATNTNLLLDAVRKLCAFALPKVLAVPLAEESLQSFSAFPENLRRAKSELCANIAQLDAVTLELTDRITALLAGYRRQQKLSDFHLIHEFFFSALELNLSEALPGLLGFLLVSAPDAVPATDQQLYRLFLQLVALRFLAQGDYSVLESLCALLKVWTEATDSVVRKQIADLAAKEHADAAVLLQTYEEKVQNNVISGFSGSDLAASSEVLNGYLRLFGCKHMRKLVGSLLKSLDTRINRLQTNSAARVIRSLSGVLTNYSQAVENGAVADGNLAREVVLRLKPFLAWKREKGRFLPAFETLKLVTVIAPVLDRLPLTPENESSAAFAIHEASNVTIPKALPALMHELIPSLQSLSLALTSSQDFACLGRLYQLLIDTTKLNPGFMDRRLRDFAPALKETLSAGTATSLRCNAQALAKELISLIDEEVVASCALPTGRSRS